MVYGWASVVTEKGEAVVDRQGDIIEPETLVRAVNKFMEHVRVGKEMHKGDPNWGGYSFYASHQRDWRSPWHPV